MGIENIKFTHFEKVPIMGILRGIEEKHIEKLAETIVSVGLRSVEITMNTNHAPLLIKILKNLTKKKLWIGAGTVLKIKQLYEALEAGAEYIVTPVVNEEVIQYCKNNNIPVFPGAYTPTEIYNAWQMGATMVKVFPASLGGPSYFKELKGPFNDIKLMAVGGVTKNNLTDFFENGASAIAFGGSIFNLNAIRNNDFAKVYSGIDELIQAYVHWKSKS
ncbi:MAG: bifunctional 4-hydroxy-2-oxoglutarate aldolase/2-dehydro-3-deoxy-phosphogluconate aldolase [Bacteroidales bacterium]|nr:bifunctional 4-hydroxy-2-oxoglutarate aldolase/2-dehydro-3-deoxy-phosphogluconate aldolase [Bacteroidales bacterium]